MWPAPGSSTNRDPGSSRCICRIAAEREVYGCTHAEVGAHLLAIWGLPNALVEAVAYHHAPQALPDTRFGVTGAIHVADWMEHAMQAPEFGGLDETYLR